ncbi:uncharacterized protein EI90DRAFT_1992941 [Cantharellus anzutake]|uniref:uncharacterized protein n=1 Tax=Cantharellus anzutake TaxID=1750568 RepID=UPI001906619E|nr:uncharacterized protein EI90DRAFT_1992941 [Cantharellus anzutake]KAF8326069.1 hypothetical protein EI90DRAFT_1992941 [Cantharellus anzutake]
MSNRYRNRSGSMNVVTLDNASRTFGFDISWDEHQHTTQDGGLIYEVHLHGGSCFQFGNRSTRMFAPYVAAGEVFIGKGRKKLVAKEEAAFSFFQAHPEFWPSY